MASGRRHAMIWRLTCPCGERFSLYGTPGALHRCWRCRKRARIVGDDYEQSLRQEVDTMLTAGPSYHATVIL